MSLVGERDTVKAYREIGGQGREYAIRCKVTETVHAISVQETNSIEAAQCHMETTKEYSSD